MLRLIYEMDNSNHEEFNRLRDTINGIIHSEKDIPIEIIKRYFYLLEKKEIAKKKDIESKVKYAIFNCIKRFNKPKYYFHVIYKGEIKSFEKMLRKIEELLPKEILRIGEKDYLTKRYLLIQLINNQIKIYCKNISFKKYRRSVIVSFIVNKIGYMMSKNLMDVESPTNKELYDAIKYYINKIDG